MTMTPTTAEQMPQPNWELVLQCVQLKANACISPELASLYTEQHAALNSWLAQGGARGGETRVFNCRRCPVSVESRWIEPDCPECGDPCEHDPSAKPAPGSAFAALAPRAEAGEAYPQDDGLPPDDAARQVRAASIEQYRARLSDTAACGVSGLVGRWRDQADVMQKTRSEFEQGRAAQKIYDADELEAALKANRGGEHINRQIAAATAEVEGHFVRGLMAISDEQVEAAAFAMEKANNPQWTSEQMDVWWLRDPFFCEQKTAWSGFSGTRKEKRIWEARIALTAAKDSNGEVMTSQYDGPEDGPNQYTKAAEYPPPNVTPMSLGRAVEVLNELLRRFDATIPTPLNRRGESTMAIEHHIDLSWDAKQAIAALNADASRWRRLTDPERDCFLPHVVDQYGDTLSGQAIVDEIDREIVRDD